MKADRKRWRPPRSLALWLLGTSLFALAPELLPEDLPAPERPFVASVGELIRLEPAPVLELDRKGHSRTGQGLFFLPSSFRPTSGEYDLVLHFHGNTDLVKQSYQRVGINAVVVVFNFGEGSGRYEEYFANPHNNKIMLRRIDEELERRGLPEPKLRRIALSSWSAGYGGTLELLKQDWFAQKVDAVLLLDGLHATELQDGSLELAPIRSITNFAEKAADGKGLFVATHGRAETYGYKSVLETTSAMLDELGIQRRADTETTDLPDLPSIDGILPKKQLNPLTIASSAEQGGLHIVETTGADAPMHIMHLAQMSETALPYLVERWDAPRLVFGDH